MALTSGEILKKRYKILSLLGRGGFGKTYKAKDLGRSRHRLCVVKEIVPPSSPNQKLWGEIKERFEREAKTLGKLGEHCQIPELIDFFVENEQFYLILEFVKGHDLTEEMGSNLPPWSEMSVIDLLKDVLGVLAFVHQHQIIHRDLKPSNLRRRDSDGKIVLLDFGAVKEIGSATDFSNTTQAIGTPGYIPAEQQQGHPQLNSDLYSLGMISIQALTGVHPRNLPSDPNSGEIIWRYTTPNKGMITISSELERILYKMVRYHYSNRYGSAIEALAEVENSPLTVHPAVKRHLIVSESIPTRKIHPLFLKIGLGALLLGGSFLGVLLSRPSTCPVVLDDKLSCGEEILLKTDTSPEKQAGVIAYEQGKYQEAIAWFEKHRQIDRYDPENLIYLNNAQLEVQKRPFDTIAAAVPLNNPRDGGDAGKEILRGIAHFQTEINDQVSVSGRGLRVLIGDDANDGQQAQQIAKRIVKQPDILGIVGHYSSDSTRNALPTYQDAHLVLISPTSTAQTLAEDSSIFFRTVPRDEVNASALAQYLFHQLKQQKVALFYNPNSAYSRSLQEQFRLSFDAQGGQVVKQFDLSQAIFEAEQGIDQSLARGATGFVIFPDARVNPYAFSNALKLIRANTKRYWMVGGDSLYTSDILQERNGVDRLIVAIPWHFLGNTNPTYSEQAQNLWGKEVSWRTAMAYDATKVLWLGINQQTPLNWLQKGQNFFNPSIIRKNILNSLRKPDFKTEGATGDIQFELSGDRKTTHRLDSVQLVKILPSSCSPYGYLFIPIQYSAAEAIKLSCENKSNKPEIKSKIAN